MKIIKNLGFKILNDSSMPEDEYQKLLYDRFLKIKIKHFDLNNKSDK